MGTALVYLLVMVGVAAVVFVAAALIFGRGEELAPLPPGHTPTKLPFGEVAGDDVRAVRFQQVLRGYRMSEVDWLLERLAAELDRTRVERAQLRSRVDELERPSPSTDGSEAQLPASKTDEPELPASKTDEPERPAPEPESPELPAGNADEPERPAPEPESPELPAGNADEPARPARRVGEAAQPTPGFRQMLSRETEDAGER